MHRVVVVNVAFEVAEAKVHMKPRCVKAIIKKYFLNGSVEEAPIYFYIKIYTKLQQSTFYKVIKPKKRKGKYTNCNTIATN